MRLPQWTTALSIVLLGSTVRTESAAKNALERPKACIPRAQCCRVCTTGSACGNWCTSQIFNCQKARGCACNAADVCKP